MGSRSLLFSPSLEDDESAPSNIERDLESAALKASIWRSGYEGG